MAKIILNIKELADYLNCSISTIRNLLRKGELPHFRIGKKIYFKKESIDKWVDGNESK